jgi:hypothetical protein
MKKLIILITILITLAFSMPAVAGKDKRNKRYKKNNKQYEQQYNRGGDRHGYRYKHHGQRRHHPKQYRGHWRSWDSWREHRHNNNNMYREGRYYKRNNQLYFEFENGDGRFVFSIGR